MIAPVMGEASFVGAGSAAEEALGTSAGTGAHASARGQGALKAASGSATPGSVSGKSAGNAAQLQKSWQSELAEQTNRLTGKSYSASGAGSGLGSGLDPDSGLSELNLEDSDLDMGSNLDSGNEGAAGSAGKSSLATSAAMTLASTTGQRGARQILSQSAGDGSGALTSKQLSSRMASLRNQSVNQSANQSVSAAGTLNARQSLTVADRSTASGATIAEHRNSAELHLSVSDAASTGQSANLPAHLQEAVATAAGLASAVPQSSSMLSESAPATAHSPSDSVASGVTRRVSAGIESSGLRAVTSAGSAASGNAASGRVSDTVLSSSSAISVGIPASSTLNGSGQEAASGTNQTGSWPSSLAGSGGGVLSAVHSQLSGVQTPSAEPPVGSKAVGQEIAAVPVAASSTLESTSRIFPAAQAGLSHGTSGVDQRAETSAQPASFVSTAGEDSPSLAVAEAGASSSVLQSGQTPVPVATGEQHSLRTSVSAGAARANLGVSRVQAGDDPAGSAPSASALEKPSAATLPASEVASRPAAEAASGLASRSVSGAASEGRKSSANRSANGGAAAVALVDTGHGGGEFSLSAAPAPERVSSSGSMSPSGRGAANADPFQVMDAAPSQTSTASGSDGRAITGSSSASTVGQLQVGYHDPVLGYVELRAHSDGSGIHASLGTQSEAAGAALSSNLGDLTAWMNARHTPVESLSVLAPHERPDLPSSFTSSHGDTAGSGGNPGGYTGGGSGQGSGQAFAGGSGDSQQAGGGVSAVEGSLPASANLVAAAQGQGSQGQGSQGEAAFSSGGRISILV